MPNETAFFVEWFAPFFSGGGYSSEAIAFATALDDYGVPIKIVQHGDSFNKRFVDSLPDDLMERLVDLTTRTKPSSGSRLHVSICHSEPGAWHPSAWERTRCPPRGAGLAVGRTMFETDRLPAGWAARLGKMDQIWVPTEHSRKIFVEGGVPQEKLRVLGEAVDSVYFDPAAAAAAAGGEEEGGGAGPTQHAPPAAAAAAVPGRRPGDFLWLSVFKWEERKGWDVLLKAYFSAFTKDDPVLLAILTSEYHSKGGLTTFETQIKDFAIQENFDIEMLPRVQLLTSLSQAGLRALYAAAGAVALPTRGEGWGRPHAEAMAMGRPVAATAWSGPTEFMNANNSYPIKINGLTEVKSGPFAGHMWADPSAEHLAEIMRHIFSNKEEAEQKGAQARQDMIQYYSPRVLAMQVQELLEDISITSSAAQKTIKNKHHEYKHGDGDDSQRPGKDAVDVEGLIMDVKLIDVLFVILAVCSGYIIMKKVIRATRKKIKLKRA